MRDWRYAPDLPVDTPNTWRIVDGFHPDIYGNYRTGWLPAAAISTATGAGRNFCYGFCYQVAAGGNAQVLLVSPGYGGGAPVATRAYVWDGSGWTNRTGTFATVTEGGLMPAFAQVGNITLAGAVTGGLYQRDATGVANFAAVGAGAPTSVGGLATSALNITLAIDTVSDAWATSDTNTPLVWNSGEAATGNVRQRPGNNTACAALGNDFIVFKQRGVFRMTYIGGTIKWTENLIDPEKGAWGQGSVCTADGKVFFIGNAGVWSYDGASFERCDYGVWQTLLGSLGVNGAFVSGFSNFTETQLVFDSVSQNIFFFGLSSTDSGTRGTNAPYFYTYNVRSKRWGKQTRFGDTANSDSIYGAFNVAPLNTFLTTWGSGDGSGGRLLNTDVGLYSTTSDKVEALSTLFTPTGVPGTNYKPSLRTSRFGQIARKTLVTRFTPGWTLSDGRGTDLSTATVKEAATFYGESNIQGNSTGVTVNLSGDGVWADYTKTARFHNVELHINCDAVIDGGDWTSTDAGAA